MYLAGWIIADPVFFCIILKHFVPLVCLFEVIIISLRSVRSAFTKIFNKYLSGKDCSMCLVEWIIADPCLFFCLPLGLNWYG